MRAVAVLAQRDIGLQRECRDVVLAGILPSIGDRRGLPQVIETLAEGGADCRESVGVSAACTMDHERWEDVEPGVIQDSVVDGKQDVVDGAIDVILPSEFLTSFYTSFADAKNARALLDAPDNAGALRTLR